MKVDNTRTKLTPPPTPGWSPPFGLYAAGRETVSGPAYRHDCRQSPGPQRVLLKRTLAGSGVVYAGGQRWPIPPQHLMVIERPGDFVYTHEQTAAPWTFEYVTVAILNPGESLLPRALREQPVFDLRPHPGLAQRHAELVALRLARDYRQSLRDSAQAYGLLLAYIATRLETELDGPPPLAKVRQHLARNLAAPVNLAALAAACGCRPETLIRRFRAVYGLPPMRYRLLLRLRRAGEMLEYNSFSIKEIATACGFETADYFARQFRACLGLSPGQYRRAPDPLLLARLLPPGL